MERRLKEQSYIDPHPFYANPVQCKFWNGIEWRYGITIYDYTIDAEDGETYINDVCADKAAAAKLDDWIIEYNWLDLRHHLINEGT